VAPGGSGMFIVVPRPAPVPVSVTRPVPGYSGHWCIDTYATLSSSQNASWVPLPWWASKSTISTRFPSATSVAAATATLLRRQKPIACSGVA